MYATVQAHEIELKAQLPGHVVDELINEARTVGPELEKHPRVLLVAEVDAGSDR